MRKPAILGARAVLLTLILAAGLGFEPVCRAGMAAGAHPVSDHHPAPCAPNITHSSADCLLCFAAAPPVKVAALAAAGHAVFASPAAPAGHGLTPEPDPPPPRTAQARQFV